MSFTVAKHSWPECAIAIPVWLVNRHYDAALEDATNKLDILDFLRGATASTLTWTSRPTRLYRIGQSTDLAAWLSSDSFAPDAGDSTTRLTRHDPGPRRFFKVEAVLPLQK